MFKNKKSTALTYIATGTKFTGDTFFSGDALIAGELHGKIHSEGMITIDNEGIIEGETHCHQLKISGIYRGKLHCENLVITSTGILEGEVISTQMEILEGGQFIGVRHKVHVELQEPNKLTHQEPEFHEKDILHHNESSDSKSTH